MGIRGLANFISNRRLYEMYELHDTKVVVDGNNLYIILSNSVKSKSDFFYGSDYKDFISNTKFFFRQFKTCNITPIVIFNGARDNYKMKTKKRKYEKKLESDCVEIERIDQSRVIKRSYHFKYDLPAKQIFQEILKEMNIEYIQALGDADYDIATVAKIIGCPILSSDSDFFTYNNHFIYFRKIKDGFVRSRTTGGFAKLCYLFKPELLHKTYPNLDLSSLPLLSILVGDNYCHQDFFTEFYDSIKGQTDLEDDPINLARIRLLFEWLENKTLHEAINQLFVIMPKEKHEEMFDILEHIFGISKIFPAGILKSLGFSQGEITRFLNTHQKEKRNILEPIVQIAVKNGIEQSNHLNPPDIATFLGKFPEWLKEEVLSGLHQRIIVKLLYGQITMHQRYTPVCSFSQNGLISHPIIILIYTLITKGTGECKPSLYVEKCEYGDGSANIGHKIQTMEVREIIPSEKLPSIHELRDLSLKERKVIMDEALGVTPEMGLELLSKSWQFIVGIIFYWLKEDIQPRRNKFHAYSAVFLMIKSIVITKLKEKQESWRRNSVRTLCDNLTMDTSLENAIAEVTEEDCWIVKRYITENSKETSQTPDYENVNLNDIDIYYMYQYCIMDLISLNKILGNVYENPSIKYLFSGTLFYNLHTDFNGRADIDMYIEEKLQNAPSLLRVFKILMNQVKKMCDELKLELFSNKSSVPVMNVLQVATSTPSRNMFFPFKKEAKL